MKRFLIVPFFLFALGYGFSDTNTFTEYFNSIDASNSDVIIQAMHMDNLDMVYSGIKRIGELKLTNAKKEVYEWIAQANPSANMGKEATSQQMRYIYRISIWTLSQIGSEVDAKELVSYLKDNKGQDKETLKVMIQALGEIRPSESGLKALNLLTQDPTITDQSIAEELLAAIVKHNSKTSANYLILWSKRPIFSPEFKNRLESTALSLLTNGK